ncbi:MAG: ATP synthase F1 subunit epsilon [Pseudomonadota bacterium]
MAEKLNFEMVSPERVLTSEPCDMVVIPGEEGDFGVLVDHAPIVALLRPGVVEIYQDDKVDERIFIVGGFAEVSADGCVLLTEEGIPLESFEKAEAERRLDTARRDLADIEDEGPAKERAARALQVAQALMDSVNAA